MEHGFYAWFAAPLPAAAMAMAHPPMRAERRRFVVVLGTPATTATATARHCARLASELGFVHISSGELLQRAVTPSGWPPPRDLREMGVAGANVADGVAIDLVSAAVHEARAPHPARPLLLSDFPRSVAQARWVDENLGKPELVVLLGRTEQLSGEEEGEENEGQEVQDAESARRIVESYDNRARWATFATHTLPVVRYYVQRIKLAGGEDHRDASTDASEESTYADLRVCVGGRMGADAVATAPVSDDGPRLARAGDVTMPSQQHQQQHPMAVRGVSDEHGARAMPVSRPHSQLGGQATGGSSPQAVPKVDDSRDSDTPTREWWLAPKYQRRLEEEDRVVAATKVQALYRGKRARGAAAAAQQAHEEAQQQEVAGGGGSGGGADRGPFEVVFTVEGKLGLSFNMERSATGAFEPRVVVTHSEWGHRQPSPHRTHSYWPWTQPPLFVLRRRQRQCNDTG
jgi:adenylate kinase family enzyme